MIESRQGGVGVGFGADVRSASEKDVGALFSDVRPEDLIKFGLIPEFIGRLPVVGTVSQLEVEALFEFENVELDVDDDALVAIAEHALERGTGARGLRAILEDVLLDVMYELPGDDEAGRVVVDLETVKGHAAPTVLPRSAERPDRAAS